jgi:hypothetical protein
MHLPDSKEVFVARSSDLNHRSGRLELRGFQSRAHAWCFRRRRADEEARPMQPRDAGPYGGERPHVLVAEHDTVTRLILKHWILRWGYEIVVVDSGTDAWEILQ